VQPHFVSDVCTISIMYSLYPVDCARLTMTVWELDQSVNRSHASA